MNIVSDNIPKTKTEICKKYLLQIQKKLAVNTWAKERPTCKQEIIELLKTCNQIFGEIPGYIKVLKSILENLSRSDSIKWLNYFSIIRCAYYLQTQGVNITAFEKKKNRNPIDLEINKKTLCEIKSFEPRLEKTDNAIALEEYVFDNFLKNKIIKALEKQKADLVIIDDIFSYESKNYGFLNYFLSFINDPDTERYEMIQKKLGKYLPKILILSFTSSMAINPIIRDLMGNEWAKLLSQRKLKTHTRCVPA
jgi:hypothetical protein